jgi:hypothetical protein
LASKGALEIPVLAVSGAAITTGPLMADMMRVVAEHVTEFRMPRDPYWIVMENPDALFDELHAFLNAH